MSKISYRPEIDGLRALAVTAVIAFHLGARWVPGGFAGVDVFFVISGYLITSILLKDLSSGTLKLSHFWVRRVRRLAPALATLLVCTLVTSSLVLFQAELPFVGRQGLAAVFSFTNVFFWLATGSYWGPQAAAQPLLHMWSLSVEEQFYLFFPLLLVLGYRFAFRWLPHLTAAGILASLALGIVASYRSPIAAFYLLPPRAWELGAGCLLAIIEFRSHDRGPRALAPVVGSLGIVGLFASYWLLGGTVAWPGYAALLPVGSTVAVIACGDHPRGLARPLLANPVCRYVGKASYSLYLWHWPVIVLARVASKTTAVTLPLAVVVVVITALGLFSYHFIERFGRVGRGWIPYVSLTAGLAALLSAGLSLSRFDHDITGFAPVEWHGREYDVTPEQEPWSGDSGQLMRGIVAPLRNQRSANFYETGGLIKRYGGTNPDLVVLGDSHALMWSSTVDRIAADEHLTVAFDAADGTPPLFAADPRPRKTLFFAPEQMAAFDAARLRSLAAWKPKTIVFVARWDILESTETELETFLNLLVSFGSRVIVVTQPPMLFYGNNNALNVASELRARGALTATLPTGREEQWHAGDERLRHAVRHVSAVRLIDVGESYFRPGGRARFIDGNHIVYIDENHLSEYGTSLSATPLRDAIVGAATTRTL